MLIIPNKDATAPGDLAMYMRKIWQTAGLVFECVPFFFSFEDSKQFHMVPTNISLRPDAGSITLRRCPGMSWQLLSRHLI